MALQVLLGKGVFWNTSTTYKGGKSLVHQHSQTMHGRKPLYQNSQDLRPEHKHHEPNVMLKMYE